MTQVTLHGQGQFSTAQNRMKAPTRVGFYIASRPTQERSIFRHVRRHQERGFSVKLEQTKQVPLFLPLVIAFERCRKANRGAVAQAPAPAEVL